MEDPEPSTSATRQDEVDFVSLPFPNFNRSNSKDMVSKMITKSLVDIGALSFMYLLILNIFTYTCKVSSKSEQFKFPNRNLEQTRFMIIA